MTFGRQQHNPDLNWENNSDISDDPSDNHPDSWPFSHLESSSYEPLINPNKLAIKQSRYYLSDLKFDIDSDAEPSVNNFRYENQEKISDILSLNGKEQLPSNDKFPAFVYETIEKSEDPRIKLIMVF